MDVVTLQQAAVAANKRSPFVSPRDYGAKADARSVSDAAMTSGSATLTSATANFTSGDVGKWVLVGNAATSLTVWWLQAQISSVESATSCTLSANAGHTVTGTVCKIQGTVATTAVQNAFNAAAAAGRSVLILGDYWVDATITVPSNTHIVGTGGHYLGAMSSSIILIGGVTSDLIHNASFGTAGDFNITADGVDFYGPYSGNGVTWYMQGQAGSLCHGIRLRDCYFNFGFHSIYFKTVQESEISSCWQLYASHQAIQCDTVLDTAIVGNQLCSNQTSGGDGIQLAVGSDHNIVRGNFCFLSANGIGIVQGRANIITGNRCNTNRANGIYLEGVGAADCQRNIVSNNHCYSNGQGGAGGTRSGITIDGASQYNVVNGNWMNDEAASSKKQVNGLRIAGTATQNIIIGNSASGNSGTAYNNTSTGKNVSHSNTWDSALGLPLDQGSVVEVRNTLTLASNGAVTFDASLGNHQVATLQANATSSSITNPVTGQRLVLTFLQDGTGGRTYAYPANCKFAAGSAPSDTTASKRTTVEFSYDGTNWNEIGRAVAVG